GGGAAQVAARRLVLEDEVAVVVVDGPVVGQSAAVAVHQHRRRRAVAVGDDLARLDVHDLPLAAGHRDDLEALGGIAEVAPVVDGGVLGGGEAVDVQRV